MPTMPATIAACSESEPAEADTVLCLLGDDLDREGASVEYRCEVGCLPLGEVAGDRHRVGEARLVHLGRRLHDAVEHDRDLTAQAGLRRRAGRFRVVALARQAVPGGLAIAPQVDGDAPALIERDLGAAPLEDLAGALGRADADDRPIPARQEFGSRDGRLRDDGSVGRCRSRGNRVGGSVSVGWSWSGGALGRRRPAGSTAVPVGAGSSSAPWWGRPLRSGPVSVVVPSVAGQSEKFRTGRSSTTPDTSTALSASSWSLTPGRSTTMV